MQFDERTIKVMIDDEKCLGCTTYPCVDACKKFARGILVLKDGKPALGGDAEFAKLRGTECLACEVDCRALGAGGGHVHLPVPGLDEYRASRGME